MAQESRFARSGVFAIGADRMLGLLRTSVTASQGTAESTSSSLEFSLLTRGTDNSSPYAAPRLSFDGFVSDGISIGALFGVTTQSLEIELPTGTTEDGPSDTTITVGARVGYAHMFSDVVGIWPKLGLTYFTESAEDSDGDEVDIDGLAFSADVMLVIVPVPHFGFTLGPVVDVGLTGSTEYTAADVDTIITDFGLQAGILGWL